MIRLQVTSECIHFCLKVVYLSLYWRFHQSLLMSIHVQHAQKIQNTYHQNPSDFSEVHFMPEISTPYLA